MLELMKESTTTGLTRFCFTVPDCEAIKVEKTILAILEIVADKQDDEVDILPSQKARDSYRVRAQAL